MNIDKFKKIVKEEIIGVSQEGPINNPEDWRQVKPKIEKMVKEIDKAVEVYELENSPSKTRK